MSGTEDIGIPEPPTRPSAAESLKRQSRNPRLSLRDEPIRAEQLRTVEPTGEPRLQRNRKRHRNPLDIPKHLIPDGMTYEWKRKSVFGQPDVDHMVDLQDNHWRPVPASRHPHLMPENEQAGSIERRGLILMERPSYLTEEAREEDYMAARQEVLRQEGKMASAPPGTFTRQHGSAGVKTRHSYEATVPSQVVNESMYVPKE